MKILNKDLIEDLIQRTQKVINEVEGFKKMDTSQLNWKENAEKWSVLECIEHLNRYGDFYTPEITKRIQAGKKGQPTDTFKSGFLLGNYFAKSMLPKEKLNTMKTFKSMNPVGSNLDKSTLDKFITHQKKMLDLLNNARNIDMNKTRTSISISNMIKLKLGDTFRVVIYHNQRHIIQAKNVIKSMNA